MKLLILTAIIAAVAASPLVPEQTWPWQVGKVYRYEATSSTTTHFAEDVEAGNFIRAHFIVSVKAAGHLQAKLENAQYASLTPANVDVETQPIQNIDQTFDIFVDGGRIVSINFPSSLSVVHENVIKSFINVLQVDVSTYGHVDDYPNSYDKESFQGLFKKMEYDLYGDCETLYSVSPVSAEWRQELPSFASEADPIEIVKTKNYGSCTKRMAYAFGVPEGAVWKGFAKGNDEKQFIEYTSTARILVGKEGTIYKSELSSSVLASPVLYGKQKATVKSTVAVYLKSVEQDNSSEWGKCKDCRSVNSVIFSLDNSYQLFSYGAEGNVAKAQKVLQEITPMLQDPGHLGNSDFLIKFNVLVYVLISMNAEQLTQLSSSIEIARTSKNAAKNGMWIIYRDALAQSGNARAFAEIKSWVLTKKIEGEEAAQVITSIGTTLAPSKALLTDFFNFATSPEVQGQKELRNSALLAVTRLLRSSKEDQFIVETVIPYLSKELKQAIENGESSKAQVYVVVLGNLAHPGILKAFAPYLEGQVTVSTYLRTQMVTSLKSLANLKDKYVRSVLFSILKNTAEPYEVRVAAALNIFLAFPTVEMMQVMAHMTNEDPSTQVRAVLTTSIGFAAGLKDPRFAELARTAKSVLGLVSKEKFGYSYSADSLIDSYTSDDEFSFFRELSFIGSADTLLPKYHRTALRFKGTAFDDESQITLSVSDVLDVITSQASKILALGKSDAKFKFTAEEIFKTLKLKLATHEPLEGAMFMKVLNQQKLFTFNEKELFAFLKNLFGGNKDIATKGVNINYTKILRQNLVNLDLPLASGMPFTYQYSEPMIINVNVEAKPTFDQQAMVGSLETELNATYARNIIGTVGFMDTIADILVGAGVINKVQIHLPATIKTSYKIGGDVSVQIQPFQTENDINMLHLSVLPYVGSQKKNSIAYNLNVIKRSPKYLDTTNVKFGYWTGMFYNLYGKSYSADFKDIEKTFDSDLLGNLGKLLYQQDIAFTDYNLIYLSKDATTKSATFTVHFDKLYNQKNAGELSPAPSTGHVELNDASRREEIVKKVSAGIESADVTLLDVSAVFDGQKKIEYVFTGAFANSFIDPKFQALFIGRGCDKITALFKMNNEGAKIVPLNFAEALKNQIKVTYGANLLIGDKVNIFLEGTGERSAEYTESLKNDPTGKTCLGDVSEHNFYQKECHKMIIKAHAPDHFKATVSYKGDNLAYWELLDTYYKYLKDEFSWEEDINIVTKTNDDKVEFEGKAYYLDNYYNFNFTTKYGLLSLKNLEGMWYHPYAMAVYAPINVRERSRNWFTDYQFLPYCAVDDNKVRTFSGRSYDYKLTSSWHVVMVDANAFKDLVILARRPSDNAEEVYVSYSSETGKFIELEIKPNHVEVKTNVAKKNDGALTMYWDDSSYLASPLLEYYTLAEGIQVFNLHDRHIRLVYDQQRLIVLADEHRSSTRGICGQSSGQTSDDYLTPFGLVTLPEHFGASFSLEGEFSDPKTVEFKNEAKLKAYQPVTKFTKVLSSDADWSKVINKTVKSTVV